MIRDEAQKRNLKLVLAVADEAGSHPWTTEATQHYNRLIKQEVPDVIRELTVGGGWAMKRPEHELWKGLINIWTTNRWLPEQFALVRANDPEAKFQLYNMGGAGSQAGGLQSVRNLYGFFNWKAKAHGVAQWVYYHDGTPEHNYTWPAQNAPGSAAQGNVPTLRWEAMREGVKDRRYIATLEARLVGKGDKAAMLVAEAREFLKKIELQIELRHLDYDAISGGRIPAQAAGVYEQWREKVAELIEKLSQSKG